MSDAEFPQRGRSSGSVGAVVAVAVVVIVLVVFVVQNTGDTKVTWLVFDNEAPLWLVIVIAAVAGALLSEIVGWVIRRRRRD